MVEVKNQFGNHLIFWVLALPFVFLLLMPMFMSPSAFVVHAEEVIFFSDLGADTVAATETANSWFQSWFVDSGIKRFFHATFVNANLDLGRGLEYGTRAPTVARKASSLWNDGFWNILFRAAWRFSVLWPVLLSGIIAFGLPSFIDGLAVRAKKKYNYEVHNPLFFYASAHLVVLILGSAITLLFLPWALEGLYIAAFFVLLASALWFAAANFQSGL
jgi:hypothetical protein